MHWGFLFYLDNRGLVGLGSSSGQSAYRNFCGALDWFSLSVGGVGVSRGGVEFGPIGTFVVL